MKLWCLGWLSCAVVTTAWLYQQRHSEPQKVINWTPADRYQMEIDPWGRVWRLDKATGTIHVVSGSLSFDVPEYRNE